MRIEYDSACAEGRLDVGLFDLELFEELVLACSNLGSPYYTVDFAERVDGTWIVVETGDGQVSGLAAAQDPVIYYQVLADALERRDADGGRACASGIRT